MGNSTSSEKETVIYCPVHNLPISGICGDPECTEGGFICTKCNPEPCTTSRSHELLSVDNFYLRYFAKSSSMVDFKELDQLFTKINNINKEKVIKQVEEYKTRANSLINSNLSHFNKTIIDKIEQIKRNVNSKLESLYRAYLEAETRIDLTNFEIPENFTLEETKKFFEKNLNSVKDMENMVNLIKKYSDSEKLQSNQKDMETILYSKNLADSNVDDTFKESLEGIINEMKEGLNELFKIVITEREFSRIFLSNLKKYTSDPVTFAFQKDLTKNAQKSYTIDSVVSAFQTFDGKILGAWAATGNSIEVYDLKASSLLKTLTGHSQHVYIVRHFPNHRNKVDYLLSTSYEKSCKIWNLQNLSCVLTISNCHSGCYLYSALILFKETKSFVVTSSPNEFMKVWDFETGTHVRDIGTKSDYTYFLGSWENVKQNKTEIINANSISVKLYDFETGNLYKNFKASSTSWHMSALVYEYKDVPYLIESDGNGYLRLWNINTGNIYKTVHLPGCNLRGLCLWNDQYILVASSDKCIKVIDIQKGKLETSLPGHQNVLCSVEKFEHPTFGECMLSSAIDGTVKLWYHKK